MSNPGTPPETSSAKPILEAEGLVAIDGKNFSGRTALLREWVGLGVDEGGSIANLDDRCAYIGPEIYNALSGLATSVDDEIRLHLEKSVSPMDQNHLLEVLGLSRVRSRSPFELSGGEQALTALAAALALSPKRLALDCCFEQVDSELREHVLELLRPEVERGTTVAIADNRMNEYSLSTFRRVRTLDSPVNTDRAVSRLTALNPPRAVAGPLSTPGVVLAGVQFSYGRGGAPVLTDVSVTLRPGTVYLLEGKNGSGKSTLAKVLCGALRPQSGVLLADGVPFRPWKQPARVFAYHFQNPDLQLFCSSVTDELAAGPIARRMGAAAVDADVHYWAESLGLSGILDWHPLDLPFVGRKRVALAATLTMARPWLILDEPTLGQDDEASEALGCIIEQLTGRGVGVLVISHSRAFRSRLAGRRLLLEGGRIAEQD